MIDLTSGDLLKCEADALLTFPTEPTERHWREMRNRLEDIDIEAGLANLALVAMITCGNGIRSVAIPPLGRVPGGLDWREVRPASSERWDDWMGMACACSCTSRLVRLLSIQRGRQPAQPARESDRCRPRRSTSTTGAGCGGW
jgi:hypothetical protein